MRDITFAVVTAACLQVTACSSNPAGTDGGGTDVATHVDGTSDSGGGSGALAVNCRDLANLHDPHCVAPIRPEATMTGTGPRFIGTLDAVHRGFVDGNRVIAPIEHVGGASVILAVDADTGNRTVISGQYMNGTSMMTVGTGASLPAIFDIQPGPDGWYGLANGAVWRIDPATGNRTKVWDSTTGAHCAFGSAGVMFPVAGIAVGPDGSIYLPIMTTSGADAGIGLVG